MKRQINEIKKMQLLAGLITESEYQESLMIENITLDPSKLSMLVKALSKHGGSRDDKESYREIAQLLSSNQLNKAAYAIRYLDTSPKEMVYDVIIDTYPELWNMLFDNEEGDYIALATPRKGLPESKSQVNENSSSKTLENLFKGYVYRDDLTAVLKKLNFQSTEEFEQAWEDAGLELDVFETDNNGNAIYIIWSDSYDVPGDAIEFVNNKFTKIIPDEYDGGESEIEEKVNEVYGFENDDLIYDNMVTMDIDQLISDMLKTVESDPSITLKDYLLKYDSSIDDDDDFDSQKAINAYK
jgi:hypothetical protein